MIIAGSAAVSCELKIPKDQGPRQLEPGPGPLETY